MAQPIPSTAEIAKKKQQEAAAAIAAEAASQGLSLVAALPTRVLKRGEFRVSAAARARWDKVRFNLTAIVKMGIDLLRAQYAGDDDDPPWWCLLVIYTLLLIHPHPYKRHISACSAISIGEGRSRSANRIR